jgi:hypothetical protein
VVRASETDVAPTLTARLWLCALLALSLPVGSCATSRPHFVVALPNGYYLRRDRSSQPSLVKRRGGTVLAGPIAAYAVFGNVVAGCVGHWPRRDFAYPNETAFPGSPDARYFVLDTTTGRLDRDLDEAGWKARLAALGAPRSFVITAPILPM